MVSILALIAATTVAPVRCDKDREGFCQDREVQVELRRETPSVYLKLNTALGRVFTVTFPKGVEILGEPLLGNAAVFELSVQGNLVVIRPQVPEGVEIQSAADLLRESTNVQIRLRRGWLINLDLRQWYPDRSAATLKFTSTEVDAEESLIAQRVAEAEQRIKDSLEYERNNLRTLAREQAKRDMALAILQRNTCADVRETQEKGLLWVRVERLCEVGDTIHVQFRISNRANDEFRVGAVEIVGGTSTDGLPALPVFLSESGAALNQSNVLLRFGQEIRGAMVVESSSVEDEFDLRVTESGGKRRVVDVTGLGF